MKKLAGRSVRGAASLYEFIAKLTGPRALRVMVAKALKSKGTHYVAAAPAAGLSAGARLLPNDRRREGGRRAPGPDIQQYRAGVRAAARTPGRTGGSCSDEQGYLHCSPTGAWHFAKMVRNGIE